MAEIRVEQRKRGMGWLWPLIALIIVLLLIWFFMAGADDPVEPVGAPASEPGAMLMVPLIFEQPRLVA
jgi:Na+/proline symporter